MCLICLISALKKIKKQYLMINMKMDEEFSQASEIYRENILDHYKHPRNFGEIKNPDIKQRELNPLCGDEIEFFMKVGEKNVIDDVKFKGHGCAIGQASASLLYEMIKGKSLEEVENITNEKVIEQLGIHIGPVRFKCAILSLMTVKAGIEKYKKSLSKNGGN